MRDRDFDQVANGRLAGKSLAAALERRGPTLIEVWAEDFLRA